MKKSIFLTPILLLSLVACGGPAGGGENSSSSSNSSISSDGNDSSSNSSSSISPSVIFDTLTSLMNYVNGDGKTLEEEGAVSYERNATYFESVLFGTDTTTIQEQGTSYNSLSFRALGQETVVHEEEDFPEYNETTKDSYEILRTVEDDTFYQVVDYGEGKERDQATRTNYSEALRPQVEEITSTNTLSVLADFYDTYIASRVVPGFDDITPDIDENGNSAYSESFIWSSSTSYGSEINHGAEIYVVLNAEGQITTFTISYEEQENYDGNSETIASIIEQYIITYGEKTAYPGDGLTPSDYFLESFDIQLFWNDRVSVENFPADADNFPYGQYVEVEATNVYPAKALDTELTIVDSSNQDVIKITTYEGYAPTIQAIGAGQTTLTVRSEGGIEKTIDVTVVVPSASEISINVYLEHKYVGETTTVYVYLTPDNTLDTYTLTSSDNISLTIDEDGYYNATFLNAGEAYIEGSVVGHPEVKDRIEFVIEEKRTHEELEANLIGQWSGWLPHESTGEVIENAVTVEFSDEQNEDGTYKGSITFNSADTGFTFEPHKPYEFSYNAPTFDDYDVMSVEINPFTFTSMNGFEVTYDRNYARFEPNGVDANIRFEVSSSYIYTVDLDCLKLSI